MISDVALPHKTNGVTSKREEQPSPFASTVNITFRPTRPINVTINMDGLTVADMGELEKLAEGATTVETIQFLSKVIEEDVNSIPLHAMEEIMTTVMQAIGGASDPNDSEPV